MRVQIKG